jgi:hypothetical protein
MYCNIGRVRDTLYDEQCMRERRACITRPTDFYALAKPPVILLLPYPESKSKSPRNDSAVSAQFTPMAKVFMTFQQEPSPTQADDEAHSSDEADSDHEAKRQALHHLVFQDWVIKHKEKLTGVPRKTRTNLACAKWRLEQFRDGISVPYTPDHHYHWQPRNYSAISTRLTPTANVFIPS